MCGIAGVWHYDANRVVERETLARMAAAIRHRGPDGWGLYRDGAVGLAHLRLAMVDPEGGWQPMVTAERDLVITYNGEIFNWLELRSELEARGHRFRTHSDTEVLLLAYREWGENALVRLNGEFAFALYDRPGQRLLLARDRLGVRPLYYAEEEGAFYFASEVKALFATGRVPRAPDLEGLEEVFTMWAAQPPRTPFRGVYCLPPGHLAVLTRHGAATRAYYRLRYPEQPVPAPADAAEQVGELLRSAVRLRMRADVPVGAYVSGGLDSSITTVLARRETGLPIESFSVTFAEPALNEAAFQQQVARLARTRHHGLALTHGEIAAAFPECIWHAETPLVRTAPAPLLLLSRLTRATGVRAVLTGEGADEAFLGYDLFKELQIRLFCARQPGSQWRPRLFERLYPYFEQRPGRAGEFWRRFFLEAGDPQDLLASHHLRFALTARIQAFLTPEARAALPGCCVARLRESLPPEFAHWHPLHRAAYLEIRTLLGPYLLASQGDRMAAAHGVEGRFPFLDHRLYEFAASLPPQMKLRGLQDKAVLREWARHVLPPELSQRPKQPYRAPDAATFFRDGTPEYVKELLSGCALRQAGWFAPEAIAGLVRRCREGRVAGFREQMAFVAALSTQIWQRQFFDAFDPPGPEALPPPRVLLEPMSRAT